MSETTKEVGTRIGRAIARDVIADGMPREWTGLDPQDADQIPEGLDHDKVAAIAKAEFKRAVTSEPRKTRERIAPSLRLLTDDKAKLEAIRQHHGLSNLQATNEFLIHREFRRIARTQRDSRPANLPPNAIKVTLTPEMLKKGQGDEL